MSKFLLWERRSHSISYVGTPFPCVPAPLHHWRSVPEKLFSLIIKIGRQKNEQLCIFTRCSRISLTKPSPIVAIWIRPSYISN